MLTAGRLKNSVGYEATDEAFYHSRALVMRVAESGRYPLIQVGLQQFLESTQITHLKVPDQAMEFLQIFKDAFWETFQRVMFATVPIGHWNSESRDALFNCYLELTKTFPDHYQGTEAEFGDLCSFAIEALDECQIEKNQVLIQPVLEVILIVWFHYIFIVWRENKNRNTDSDTA